MQCSWSPPVLVIHHRTVPSYMCWKDRLRYPNYRAPQGRGFWSGNTTLDSEHPLWRHRALLSTFLSLQRSRCDSPKPCSSSEGPGQDTVWPASPALAPALGEGLYCSSAGQIESPGSRCVGSCIASIQLCGGRGPWAVLAAEETMERKALISPAMDTLLLKGGADGRNWGPGARFFAFILC